MIKTDFYWIDPGVEGVFTALGFGSHVGMRIGRQFIWITPVDLSKEACRLGASTVLIRSSLGWSYTGRGFMDLLAAEGLEESEELAGKAI